MGLVLLVMEHDFVENVIVDLLSFLSDLHSFADLFPHQTLPITLFFALVLLEDLVASDDVVELIN